MKRFFRFLARPLPSAIICGALAVGMAQLYLRDTLLSAPATGGTWPQQLGALLLALSLAWSTRVIPSVAQKIALALLALTETVLLSGALLFLGIAWPPYSPLIAGITALLLATLWNLLTPKKRETPAQPETPEAKKQQAKEPEEKAQESKETPPTPAMDGMDSMDKMDTMDISPCCHCEERSDAATSLATEVASLRSQ